MAIAKKSKYEKEKNQRGIWGRNPADASREHRKGFRLIVSIA